MCDDEEKMMRLQYRTEDRQTMYFAEPVALWFHPFSLSGLSEARSSFIKAGEC